MIAADTSVIIDYFKGIDNPNTKKLDEAFYLNAIVLPPTVLCEILSDPNLPKVFINNILELPLLEPKKDFWQRAGFNRGTLIAKKLKARLADTLIAQSCIDYKIPLITCDSDFRHFVQYCGLVIL